MHALVPIIVLIPLPQMEVYFNFHLEDPHQVVLFESLESDWYGKWERRINPAILDRVDKVQFRNWVKQTKRENWHLYSRIHIHISHDIKIPGPVYKIGRYGDWVKLPKVKPYILEWNQFLECVWFDYFQEELNRAWAAQLQKRDKARLQEDVNLIIDGWVKELKRNEEWIVYNRYHYFYRRAGKHYAYLDWQCVKDGDWESGHENKEFIPRPAIAWSNPPKNPIRKPF